MTENTTVCLPVYTTRHDAHCDISASVSYLCLSVPLPLNKQLGLSAPRTVDKLLSNTGEVKRMSFKGKSLETSTSANVIVALLRVRIVN